MKKTLEHLPAIKQQELQAITQSIRQHSEVEMIILFGSYARGNWVEEFEEDGIHFKYQSDYDILVLIKNRSIKRQRELEFDTMAEMEHLPEIKTPVSIIVHDIEFVNQHLEMTQFFFSDIKKQGIVLYDSGELMLKEGRKLNNKERYILAKDDFEYYFNKARKIFKIFEFCFNNKDYNEAAFELHQVTERLYTSILLVYTRYKPNTHDLSILRRLTNAVDPRLIRIFPLRDSQEKYCFLLLRDAYVDARYKKTYTITEAELNWLAERIKALIQLTERICHEKMASFLAEKD